MAQVVILNDVSALEGEVGWGRPVGAYVLVSKLRERGISAIVVDQFTKLPNLWDILDHAITEDTIFVGISSTFLSLDTRLEQFDKTFIVDYWAGHLWCRTIEELQQFCARLKSLIRKKSKKDKSAPLILGGVKAIQFMKEPGLADLFDFFIVGKAESFIHQLTLDLLSGIEPKFTQRNNAKVITEANYKTSTETISKVIWNSSDCIEPSEPLPLEIAKGCLYNCKFCHFEKQGSIRRSGDDLKEVLIENYEKFGTTIYNFADDCFNDTKGKVSEICNTFLSLPFKIEWVGYARVDVACRFPETLDLMIESGARGLFWGIETLNHKIAKSAGKGTAPELVKEMFERARHKYGDRVIMKGSFIIGLPGETEESILSTLDWVIKKKALHMTFWPVLSIFPYSESLDKLVIDYSDYSRHPQKYGFQELSFTPYYWKHAAMDLPYALKLQRKIYQLLRENKVNSSFIGSVFQYPRLRQLGYSHDSIIDMIQFSDFGSEMHSQALERDHAKTLQYSQSLLSSLSRKERRLWTRFL